jgi:imidazolonepropionase-like amidohydrolase
MMFSHRAHGGVFCAAIVTAFAGFVSPFSFAEEKPKPQILFTNVNVFDCKSDQLVEGMNVLIEDNLIKEVAGDDIDVHENATVINGAGRTLMPGIIEGHGHVGLPVAGDQLTEQQDWQYLAVRAAATAKFFLDNGWTTVRDAGGPTFGIKKAIDEGHVPGPRIYPSGRFISQTSGHGDFRAGYASPHPNDLPVEPFFNREFGAVADGVPEVLRATREELRKGAVHIKIMAGGGIASQYDPIHTRQYSPEEMKAIVDAAADWGTYAMVHAYTDDAVRRAIEAGVKVVEHGQLMTDETAKLAADNDVWLSTQIAFLGEEPTPEQIATFGEVTAAKFRQVRQGVDTSINYAKEYGIKIAFGTDLWGPRINEITSEFAYRQKYFSNVEILRQATCGNGELLQLTGPLNPYPEGPIGVIAEGAYADILLVDGNPIEDLLLLADPTENIDLVMKDGKIYKNTLN